MALDFSKLGLKVGLEIHQQLDTAQKLFCPCISRLSTLTPNAKFYRRLRPTQSELGEVDPAAAFEYKRGRGFVYEADDETSCLVEMDEEPPHGLDWEAIDICLTVAQMLKARTVDEVHVMRKIVIDGSNTTGFQRTCVIALGGEMAINGKKISIQTICLEEDAARKTGEKGLSINYRLDRLCIPLIEIATAPEIYTPDEAGKAALALGRILRATRKVKRGLGTIRQDLNISVRGGALIEVKGVQELELVPSVVEYEVERQLKLLKVRDELVRRKLKKEDVKRTFADVTGVFRETKCSVVKNAIENGGVVLALTLPKFRDLMRIELEPDVKLGTELADYAKFWGGVGGIFHTDELPGYGITEGEASDLKAAAHAGDMDIVVFVADKRGKVIDALNAVAERARKALDGVPSETRGASPNGSTRYSRPRPGAARMYPETDVPPVPILKERVDQIKLNLPELPDVAIKRLIYEYGLNEKMATQILSSDYFDVFGNIAKKTSVSKSFIVATLTETLTGLRREGVKIDRISDQNIEMTFKLIDEGVIAKEAIPDVFTWLAEHRDSTVDKAVKSLGLQIISEDKLEALINRVIQENIALIRESGPASINQLMGVLMKQLRGKVDARLANQKLKERIQDLVKDQNT